MRKLSFLIILLLVSNFIFSQGHFYLGEVVTTNANGARSTYAIDLDGDEDIDLVSASLDDDKIAWYENTDGLGTFGSEQIISNTGDSSRAVFAIDIDNDNDNDIIAAIFGDDKVVWYENDGSGNFGTEQIVTTETNGVLSIYALDIDGDNDMDIVSGSYYDNKIAWYENLDGLGTFGTQQIISEDALHTTTVYSIDIDGDGDNDVLSSSRDDSKIAWYENLDGLGTFSTPQIISSNIANAYCVYSIDLDGDSDNDVLAASSTDDEVTWFENDGDGNFGTANIITSSADGVYTVLSIDLDNDGDNDVLSSSIVDATIYWYENIDGLGTFGGKTEIYTRYGMFSVFAADLNGDGLNDVISTSTFENEIAWLKNGELFEITTQPESYVYVDVNDDTEISLEATGATAYKWQAYVDGEFIDLPNNNHYTGTTTSNLQLIDVIEGMETTYRCIVYNGGSSIISNETQLVVNTDFVIITQPEAYVSVDEGYNTELTIEASLAESYQWQIYDGTDFIDLTESEHYTGTTTNTLQIINATFDMENSYRCIVYNSGGDFIISNTTELEVTIYFEILTQPETYVYVNETENTELSVEASIATAYRWQIYVAIDYNFENLSDSEHYSGTTTNTLQIINATEELEGIYRCVVTNDDEIIESNNSLVTVTTVDINDVNDFKLNVYPNPSNGIVFLDNKNNVDIKTIEIFDITGKLLLKEEQIDENQSFDLSKFNKGLFLFKIQTSDNKIYNLKVQIQ